MMQPDLQHISKVDWMRFRDRPETIHDTENKQRNTPYQGFLVDVRVSFNVRVVRKLMVATQVNR